MNVLITVIFIILIFEILFVFDFLSEFSISTWERRMNLLTLEYDGSRSSYFLLTRGSFLISFMSSSLISNSLGLAFANPLFTHTSELTTFESISFFYYICFLIFLMSYLLLSLYRLSILLASYIFIFHQSLLILNLPLHYSHTN